MGEGAVGAPAGSGSSNSRPARPHPATANVVSGAPSPSLPPSPPPPPPPPSVNLQKFEDKAPLKEIAAPKDDGEGTVKFDQKGTRW